MKNVLSPETLQTILDDPNVVVLDCSVMVVQNDDGSSGYHSGKNAFLARHIPGAQHADLQGALSAADSDLLFALPDPEVFRAQMETLGVHDEATVVLYDSSFTAWAARVWWMLRWIGFDTAMILDGGFAGWTEAGGATSTQVTLPRRGQLTLKLRPAVMAYQDDVRAGLADPATCLIDTLSADAFRGETDDYARRGHIAGAQNVFALSMFKEDGRFKSADALHGLFSGRVDDRQVTYCGAGILAAATAFTMVQLGYRDVALYSASLQEWAANPANPMETASTRAPNDPSEVRS